VKIERAGLRFVAMKSPEKDISVSVFARTDTGMKRAGNEDAFLVADLTTGNVGLGAKMSTHRVGERGSLMVVSDGMGGAAAGEIASAMAVKTIRDALMEDCPCDGISDQLKLATERANERIWGYSKENRKFAGMGATLTAVLVHNTFAYVAQVGDSRAYLIRGDQVKQLTKDQSLVQLLIDSGSIQPEQAHSVPQNVVMQALGTSETIEVAMASVELYKDDLLLVCTDGLSNKVAAEEMSKTVSESESLNMACRRLVELANERGGEDNITVIAARFDGEALHSAAQSNSITGSFKMLSEGRGERDISELRKQFAPSAESQQGEDATTVVLPAARPAKSPAVEENRPGRADQSKREPASTANRNYVTWVLAILGLLVVLALAYLVLRSFK
jgi:PPM family protein phosphatase